MAALAGLLVTVLLSVAGCAAAPNGEGPWPGFFAPSSTSEGGALTDSLYVYIFLIAVAVFVLVEGLLLWIVFRYRRRPVDGALPPQTHGHNGLEIMWTLVPAAIVTLLFIATLDTLAHVERVDADHEGVVIDVTGFQWQWTFRYEDEGIELTGAGAEGPVMGLPIDERVRIRLSAPTADVIHSFYVPMFRYKKDVVPGRVNEFEVVVREPGTYAGQCAEFCGLLHSDMHFTVEAMTRADYDVWVSEQQQAPEPTLPPDGEGFNVTLTAVDFETFDPSTLAVPADTPIIFDFRNVDTAQPHDVAIVDGMGPGQDWRGDPLAQPSTNLTYAAPALPAGTYEFYCAVHPVTMRGTLTVGP